jgi:putative peptidoglycan lipid II flippase
LALLWWDSTKAGIHISIKRPDFGPDMRQLVKVAIPAALANGVVQINILVGTIVASFFPGAVSWLYGADRLYQLPLGVVGIAVGIVLLPELSKKVQSGDKDAARCAFTNASEISFALSFPAAVALFVIPRPAPSMQSDCPRLFCKRCFNRFISLKKTRKPRFDLPSMPWW